MGIIAAGVVAAAGGAYLSGRAANARKKSLQSAADTPGLNITDSYNETLGASQKARPQAEALATDVNTFNQNEVDRLIAQSIPGYKELQAQRIRNAQADLAGEVSPERAAAVARQNAAWGVGSGTYNQGQTSAGINWARNLRNYGNEVDEAQARGAREFESIIGTTPMASQYAVQNYLNIDPRTGLALRADERKSKLSLLSQKAMAPSSTEVYGQALSSTGGALMSYGMGGGSFGGGAKASSGGGGGPYGGGSSWG